MASAPVGPPRPRPSSFVGPVILILIGVFLLLWKLYPGFDPWPWLFRYWPVILIAIGLGKIWDSYYAHQHPERATSPWITGTGLAWIILLLLFMLVFWHGRRWHRSGWDDSWSESPGEKHDSQAVELQGAKSVSVDVQFPAGRLEAGGGSGKLLDGDFGWYGEKPSVNYDVSGGHGQLTIIGKSNIAPWGSTDNNWHLRFANDVPMDFTFNVGAGQTFLRFDQIDLQRLNVHIGAGQLDLNLTGPRKSNLEADIEGGVGSAYIRLPRDVGVRVDASGGIGSIDTDGLRREDGMYENDAYGRTPTSIEMTVHGGIGHIELVEQ